jgi:predicted transcriptional regulator
VLRDRRHPIPKGPPKSEEDKIVFFANLVRLREEGLTIDRCALELGVSKASISNYMAEPLYKETQEQMISEAKQTGHLLISEVVPMAVEGLVDLANDNLVSPFVRFKCFETLLTFAGFSEPRETAKADSRTEVAKFLRDVDEKKRQNVYNINNVNIVQAEGKEDGGIVESVPALPEGVPQEMARYYEFVEPGGKLPASFRKNRNAPTVSSKSDIIDSNPNEG